MQVDHRDHGAHHHAERRRASAAALRRLLGERILVLDGAMGTMIQAERLDEAGYRGRLLANHDRDLKGNNDILCLTRPEVIRRIHRDYFAAGADIATTNTFNGTRIVQDDYGTGHLVRDLNFAAARLAREEADASEAADPGRPRFVAGSLAPTNRTASISPDVENPAARNVTFDELVATYAEEAEALLDGGVDILLVETVFDTLNAKAALFAISEVLRRRDEPDVPVWVSGTITDASGRTLSGQTPEAFWISVRHARPLLVGLNCALGPDLLRPHVEELARHAAAYVTAHPNAGLPNDLGGYDETPEQMARVLGEFARSGLVNLVGGCCGTTPAHIAAIAAAVRGLPPRRVPGPEPGTHLSGLEPLKIRPDSLFVNVGERTNVAGSRRFARLIREERHEEALGVARQQVEAGAQIVDVNMDDALLNSERAMTTFLNVVAGDPEIARVPIMIDSSRWSVLEAGLKCVQGKAVVNSLSLKEGEDEFRRQADLVRRYGAACIVMAFDEQGQADDRDRKVAICRRAYRILVDEVGFDPADVIFDPNVFAVATGIPEHDRYALDYIEATRIIKQELPGVLVSGGVSNLSFSFRGNDPLREAMHAVFLYHAIAAGMDLGIVNAGALPVYEDIDPELKEAVEDVILCRRADAGDRLLEVAQRGGGQRTRAVRDDAWRDLPVAERLQHALVHGIADHAGDDALAALEEIGDPLQVIEGPLMEAMSRVGDLFGAGKMFLPQVIRSARVMKKAVSVLEPHLLAARSDDVRTVGKVLLATVKGDVHDIGKNIVGVVLACNNYQVIDLGVMVPAARILQEARDRSVDVIGLSGLITPSLDEMEHVAGELQREGFEVPLLIGGATTSRTHTAVKIAPRYDHGVVHVLDASRAVGVVATLLEDRRRPAFLAETAADHARLRERRADRGDEQRLLSLDEARARRLPLDWSSYTPPEPRRPGIHHFPDFPLEELRRTVDWTPFFHTWRLRGRYPEIFEREDTGAEARRLFADAAELLDVMHREGLLQACGVAGLFPAAAAGDDIEVYADGDRREILHVARHLRQQRPRSDGACLALSDLVAPRDGGPADWVGAFVVTAGHGASELAARYVAEGDDYRAILVKALADRLAESFAERLHQLVRTDLWGYAAGEDLDNAALIREEYVGIRPAPGYPACPDHTEKAGLFRLLDATARCGVTLTESFAMAPGAAVSGWYFSHPESRYFGLGKVDRDQVTDYARRKGWTLVEAERWLRPNLGYEPTP
ncbi:MAG: methionine synthase [Candidatus Krumholzibacteriia bacterium]